VLSVHVTDYCIYAVGDQGSPKKCQDIHFCDSAYTWGV